MDFDADRMLEAGEVRNEINEMDNGHGMMPKKKKRRSKKMGKKMNAMKMRKKM